MSVIPPPKEWTRTSFTLPSALLEELEEWREKANEDRPSPEKLSRDRFVQVMLEWATQQMRKEGRK